MPHVKDELARNNGRDLATDTAISPVNPFLHSLFWQVDSHTMWLI